MSGTTTFYGVTYPSSTDYVKDGATAIQTVATGFDSAVAIPTYNAQTGATYTFVLADTGKTVTASNASSQTYTIPPTASVAWTANTTLRVLNLGAGVVTFAAGAGVTVTNTAQTLTQYQSANLVRTGLNAWTVTPDSGAAGSGMTLVKSQTVGTAVSSVTVTGAFSATYDNYIITYSDGTCTGTGTLALKLGATVSGYYESQTGNSWNGTAFNAGLTNNSQWNYTGGLNSTNGPTALINIQSPFLSKRTTISSQYLGTDVALLTSGLLNNTTSYTDFILVITTGTATGGTIRVYGYANS